MLVKCSNFTSKYPNIKITEYQNDQEFLLIRS